MVLWNSVDHFYITTYEGSPRIENLKNEILQWNIPPEKITWNIPKKIHYDNCVLASASKNHCEVYELAKQKGHKNIIVLEDDVVVYNHIVNIPLISEKTEYFIKNYPKYDIPYYGYFPFWIPDNFSDNGIIKMYGVLQHAYLINERFYSKFNFDAAILCDISFSLYRVPIDWATLNLQIKRKESYALYPQLIYQDNCPFLKKGNKNAQISKIVCDFVTDILYNKDSIITFMIIYIIIKNIGNRI